MNRRYARLAIGLVVVGLALGVLARLPRRPEPPAPPPPPERVQLVLAIRADGSVVPERTAAPKGSEVTLVAANEGASDRTLALSGYEERVRVTVAPGATKRVVFLADRPGGDFAWLVDGSPGGRFAVTGSHLEEGRE
ncbi:MAG TPA: hypothetical protein VLT84_08910 [Acidobacteriota bacterium]|nr:hypothetical protein [Acidobacteriota bacterium]